MTLEHFPFLRSVALHGRRFQGSAAVKPRRYAKTDSTLAAVGRFSVLVAALVLLPACQSSRKQLLAADESQVKLRSIQTRAFDSTDKRALLRAIMATLQDLGFVLDNADDVLGTVSATKLDRYQLRMTVSVRPRGETQLLVRANAQYNILPVEDPEPYQHFFDALSKSVFLAAHQVD